MRGLCLCKDPPRPSLAIPIPPAFCFAHHSSFRLTIATRAKRSRFAPAAAPSHCPEAGLRTPCHDASWTTFGLWVAGGHGGWGSWGSADTSDAPPPKGRHRFLKGTSATLQDMPITGDKCPASRVSGGKGGRGWADGRRVPIWKTITAVGKAGKGGCSPLLILARRLVHRSPSSAPSPSPQKLEN